MCKEKVSIIVPVYNTSPYLDCCIQSLLHQTYDNLEIILIDDGSTDDSLKLLKEYQSKDRRIQVIADSINKGPGATRNIGVDIASGLYILFIDSDDYIKDDLIQRILSVFKDDKDIWIYNGTSFNSTTGQIVAEKYFVMEESFFETKYSFRRNIMRIIDIHSPCMKMYSSSFLRDNNIRFPEGLYGEDVEFWIRCLLNTESIGYSDYKGYFRRLRDGSIMAMDSDKNLLDRINNLDTLFGLCEGNSYLFNYLIGLYIPSITKKIHQKKEPYLVEYMDNKIKLLMKYINIYDDNSISHYD